jgi:SAM-dependent methyltransferase
MTLKVSVIVSTFNRAALLNRALATYARQTLTPRYWEYVMVDDGSTDDTRNVAAKWANAGVPIRVLDARDDLFCPKQPGTWRDGSAPRNAGSAHCFGEVLIATHPEILIPPDALEIGYEAARDWPERWHTAIPYWLPRAELEELPWEGDLSALERLPGFFAHNAACEGDSQRDNRLQAHRRDWEEDSWFAIDMGLWRRIGGLREYAEWELASVDFANRRQAMGVPTNVLTSETSRAPSGSLMVYHQWHASPREKPGTLDRVKDSAPRYADRVEALHAGALHGLYWSGHREREDENRAVLGDHVDRYQFAASYCQGKAVLDVPSGTGYGSTLLGEPFRYVGLDIDAESVRWARQRYQRPGLEFYQGSMARMPFPDASFDVVICFEGLEHLAEQQAFVEEVHRVLRPGGVFIASTPHKGRAPGTQFDRYMLDPAELLELVAGSGFIHLSWFCQGHYGGVPGTNPVMEGLSPEANIVILTGRKPAANERGSR